MNILIGTDDRDMDSLSLKIIEVHPASKMPENFVSEFNTLISEGDMFGFYSNRYFGMENAQHGNTERMLCRWYSDMVSAFDALNEIRRASASWEYSHDADAESWRIKVLTGAQSGALFAVVALEIGPWEALNGHTIGTPGAFERVGDSYYRTLALSEAGLDTFAFNKRCVYFD